MKKITKVQRNGWRFYKLARGELGVNTLRQVKWYPDYCRLNSSRVSRDDAAKWLRLERAT